MLYICLQYNDLAQCTCLYGKCRPGRSPLFCIMKFWFYNLLFGCLLVAGCSFHASAQLLPANQPEQDACGALVLCGGSFSSPYSYQGLGATNNLTNTPCGAGEANSVWLKLTASTSGTMVFTISPISTQDDYDFAVLNVTNTTCNSINQSHVIRCNFNENGPGSNVNGVVGLSTSSSQPYVAGGTFGNSYCSAITVSAGQVFLIMINNFGNYATGGPSSGFTINFAGSTATFNSPPLPKMDSVQAPDCNYKNQVTIKLSTEVKCSSIAANGSDFSISPTGSIQSAQGINCNGTQGYTDRIRLTFTTPLNPGTYTISAKTGTDGNTLLDLCNNALAVPNQVSFTVKSFSKSVSLTKCQNELPFIWNGVNVTTGGIGVVTAFTTTAKGCDSSTSLNLTVLPSYSSVVNLSICASALPYMWNGISVNAGGAGAAVYRGLKTNGCDSVITLNLNILPAYSGTVALSVCSNQLPYTWNGIVVTAGGNGVAVYHGQRLNGCDSSVSLNLSVRQTYNNTVTASTCSNRLPYNWNGFTIPAGGNGVATYHTQSVFGCDSSVTLNLNVSPPKTNTVNQAICINQLPYVWNGITVNAGGNAVAIYTGQSAAGCDSVVTLNLTLKSIYSGTENRTICSSNLPYTWNSISVANGGIAVATFRGTGAGGCDSIVKLNLTVLPSKTNEVRLTKCVNELPFVWNGIQVTTGGAAAATYSGTTTIGCDSTVKLNLTVLQPTTATLSVTGCDLVSFNSRSYTSSQVLRDTLRYVYGCDSVYRTINITVHKTNLLQVTRDTASCGPLAIDRVLYSKDTSITRRYKDVFGCDSLFLTTRLFIHPENPVFATIDTYACDSARFENVTYSGDTVLHKTFLSRWGCDSFVRTVRIHLEHLDLNVTADETAIVNGEYIRLSTSGSQLYNVTAWTPAYVFSNQYSSDQLIRPTVSATYTVFATTPLGCTDSASIRVSVDTLIADAYMPNAFTPNGDGTNDYFSPIFYSKRGYTIESFMIFNRWGQKIFTGRGPAVRWDGTFNNKPADMGTYFYTLILSFANGIEKAVKGNVELLR